MGITYYISANGSDKNTGLSSNQAWASLNMLDKVRLGAGDKVLLERGSVFKSDLVLENERGTQKAPIVIDAYGKGNNPVIQGTTHGITGLDADWVSVSNITIRNTTDSALYGKLADNWTFQNMTITGSGRSAGEAGGISWWNANGLTIKNSAIADSYGDNMWVNGSKNIVIENNNFGNVHGKSADDLQIEGSKNVIIRNNNFAIGVTDSTKGNLVFKGDYATISGNKFSGGAFGASITGNNIDISNNRFANHSKYEWSSNLLLSASKQLPNMHDINIIGNYFGGTKRDIAIDGYSSSSKFDVINIKSNFFQSWDTKPMAINKAVFSHSTFSGNSFLQPVSDNVLGALTQIITGKTTSAPSKPPSETLSGFIEIHAAGDIYSGNPLLTVYTDDKFLFSKPISAIEKKGQEQIVWLDTKLLAGHDDFTLVFSNDTHGAKGQDRNLYIHEVTLNKHEISTSHADLSGNVWHHDNGHLAFTGYGTATFNIDDLF